MNEPLLTEDTSLVSMPSSSLAFGAIVTAIDWALPYKGPNLYGSVSGWVGSSLYLFSRVTQLIKNLEKKYITDFSPFYIALIVSANATYSLSVFIRSIDSNYLWRQAPWIVGSIGPMCFDIFTACMMCYYGRVPPDYVHYEDISMPFSHAQ